MVGAARRHGRLAVPVADLPSCSAELAAGHPVLVLQNLGTRLVPAVGTLRRGRLRPHGRDLCCAPAPRPAASGFARDLEAPGRAPGIGRWWCCRRTDCPQSADDRGAEPRRARARAPRRPALAYDAILRAGRTVASALIGRGNARYAAGDLDGAEAAYRAALERRPGAAAAWNNLADVLAAKGARAEAVIAARRAVGSAARMPSCTGARSRR